MIKSFILQGKAIERDAYIWNTVSNLLFALQSVLICIILSRVISVKEVGIFSFAYANASLLLFVGKFGVRNYQVSDIKNKHSFKEYQVLRSISVIVMCIWGVIYSLVNYLNDVYNFNKAAVVLLVLLYKVPDAIEDLYYGEYQRQGRLDIASKSMTIRLGVSIASLTFGVLISGSLIFGLIISIFASFVFLIWIIYVINNRFDFDDTFSFKSMGMIFRDCIPIFLGMFLSQYLSNASKYAIDSTMSDEIQACYNYIATPVFVITLFSSIIFNPIIHNMSEYWINNQKSIFVRRIVIQILIIIAISITIIVLGEIIGIPILSLVYNTSLYEYKKEFIILLLGGGLLAISNFMNIIITIIRAQYFMLVAYIIVSIMAYIFSEQIVVNYGIYGAATLYTILMLLLAFLLAIIMIITVTYKQRKMYNE